MRSLLAVLAGAACAFAAKFHGPHPDVFGDWRVEGAAPRDSTVQLQMWLKMSNQDALRNELLAVSDPTSSRYGQHLSKAQVDALSHADPASVARVRSWMESFDGVKDVSMSADGGVLSAEVPLATAEEMLSTNYAVYRHRTTDKTAVRVQPDGYELPDAIAGDVVFVTPTSRLPVVQRTRLAASKLGMPMAGAVTPSFIKSAYNLGDAKGSNSSSNIQAVGSFLEQYYAPSDLKTFFTKLAPDSEGMSPMEEGDANNPSSPGTEASLDIEYIMGVATDVQTQFWYTSGRQPGSPENEPFLTWLQRVSALPDDQIPKAISVSYGDNEHTVEFDYAQRVNAEFQKLGTRGVSIMFSSGDGGVGGGQPSLCTKFIPTYPAGSPYVTAVGGSTPTSPEKAASLSSGGFSNYWAADEAPWQKDAVAHYFQVAQNLPSSDLYNSSGAGFPDVAAFAEDFTIVQYGFELPGVAGTSCASPTFTAVVSLLNEDRINAGKSSLGFLNPLIYKATKGFNDITEGNNPGCESKGFYAAEGWDPVTGMGSPDYATLREVVLSLP